MSVLSPFADRDAPAAHLHDPEEPGHRVRAGGHRGAGHGRPEGHHALAGQEEGGAAARASAANLQRRKILRGRIGVTRKRMSLLFIHHRPFIKYPFVPKETYFLSRFP